MDEKLRPCPFCGEKEDIGIFCDYDDFGTVIGEHILCGGCLARFEQMEVTCREDLIRAWNRRAEL